MVIQNPFGFLGCTLKQSYRDFYFEQHLFLEQLLKMLLKWSQMCLKSIWENKFKKRKRGGHLGGLHASPSAQQLKPTRLLSSPPPAHAHAPAAGVTVATA